jgi:outer membrane protein insertion porin family
MQGSITYLTGKNDMKRLIKVTSLFVLFIFAACSVSFSQESSAKRIKVIRVKENKAVSTAVILSKVRTKVGDIFSPDALNDDLKRLYKLGYFTDISIDVSDYGDGVAVSFIVEEKPVIEKIVFEGNQRLREEHLKKEMSSKEGEMLDENKLSRDVITVRKFYEKKGFHLARVDYSIEIDRAKNTATATIVIDEEAAVKIKHIFMEGNEHYSDKVILRIITTRPDTLFTSGYFEEDTFKEDLEKIKYFYQNQGYLDAAVDSGFEYYNEKRNMDITVIIDEGKKYLVGEISLRQNKIFSEQEIRDVLELTRNKAFSQDGMRLDVVKIQEMYYTNGYILCRVYPEPLVNKDTGRIDITYTVNEDKLIYVNKVEIAGNTKTKDIVIRRELRSYPGEAFDGQKIKRSKERLYNLGYFEEISFDTKETSDPNKRDLVVNVKETQTGEFSFGGGYSSIDKILGFASIAQRNFDILNFPTFTGGGQNLTVRGEFGFVRTNYFVSWTDPWIFGFPYSFGFDLYRMTHERERDTGYGWAEERWGGAARVGKDFTDWIRADAVYRIERVDIDDILEEVTSDISEEEGTNYISSLTNYLTFDTRDNVFNPMKGVYLRGGLENAGGFLLGDFDFLKGTGLAKYYISFVDAFVVELKGRAGLVTEYGDSERVPVYERFFAGGGNSIRGYSERGVGPRDQVTGDAVGGESMLIGNIELIFPVFKNLIKGAIFFDAGNVWADTKDFAIGSDYKYGAGVGIRVKTPVGPVKLDWGYPLEEIEEEEQKGRFYFSMSHGF